jgi:hypothetical protein
LYFGKQRQPFARPVERAVRANVTANKSELQRVADDFLKKFPLLHSRGRYVRPAADLHFDVGSIGS